MDYYNEFDAYPAQWLRNLQAAGHIPQGQVDERSIADVRAEELSGYRSAHFFAGVGGWPLALKLAGFPESEPVWTGSCPCQPFSVAGARKGEKDKRHLWPEFFRLIGERRPPIVFGEQVASADGRDWLAGVRADLEGLGYAVGAADLCAAGAGEEGEGWFLRGGSIFLEPTLIGAPHIRQRLYWVAYAKDSHWRPRVGGAEEGTRPEGQRGRGSSGGSLDGGVSDPESVGHGSNGLEPESGRRERATRSNGGEVVRGVEFSAIDGSEGRSQLHREHDRKVSPDGCELGGMADRDREGRGLVRSRNDEAGGNASGDDSDGRGQARRVADVQDDGLGQVSPDGRRGPGGTEAERRAAGPGLCGAPGGVGDAELRGRSSGTEQRTWATADLRTSASRPRRSFWGSFDVLPCRDGKARRVEPGTFPLAHGVPARVGKLRAYGNAIVPEAAATFIEAVLEVLSPR